VEELKQEEGGELRILKKEYMKLEDIFLRLERKVSLFDLKMI